MKYLKWIVGIVTGAAVGFGYWYFIGCNSGSCAITSSPVNSTIYGGLMGLFLVNTFPTKHKQKPEGESGLS